MPASDGYMHSQYVHHTNAVCSCTHGMLITQTRCFHVHTVCSSQNTVCSRTHGMLMHTHAGTKYSRETQFRSVLKSLKKKKHTKKQRMTDVVFSGFPLLRGPEPKCRE